MFLYTLLGILLYVVSIFNTFANVKSFYYHPVFELSDQILFIHYYWIPLSYNGKGLFFTGTSICRTTNILIYN